MRDLDVAMHSRSLVEEGPRELRRRLSLPSSLRPQETRTVSRIRWRKGVSMPPPVVSPSSVRSFAILLMLVDGFYGRLFPGRWPSERVVLVARIASASDSRSARCYVPASEPGVCVCVLSHVPVSFGDLLRGIMLGSVTSSPCLSSRWWNDGVPGCLAASFTSSGLGCLSSG